MTLTIYSSGLPISFRYHLPLQFHSLKLWIHNHLSQVWADPDLADWQALRQIRHVLAHSKNADTSQCNCNPANEVTNNMTLDAHLKIICNTGSSTNKKQHAVGGEYIHTVVTGRQLTVYHAHQQKMKSHAQYSEHFEIRVRLFSIMQCTLAGNIIIEIVFVSLRDFQTWYSIPKGV